VYPGAKVLASTRQQTDDGFTGTYSFQTPDAATEVLDRFGRELSGAGFTVERQSAGAVGTVHGKADGGARTVAATAIPIGNMTQVTVEYAATGNAKE
jgi:pyruvate/2-oxoacid:ferredoxin oxidoreductase alpha subunit